MKLSQAILLGDSLKSPDPRFFLSPDGSRGCAIGGVALAIGIKDLEGHHPADVPEFVEYFPWFTMEISAGISWQYYMVCRGKKTIEQLADYVRSIEPTDSIAPILSAGSGEDGLLCDSSPLSQVSCGTVEGHGQRLHVCSAPITSIRAEAQGRKPEGDADRENRSRPLSCSSGYLHEAPPAGIHFAEERVDEVKPSNCVGEHGSIKTSPAIHILPSRKPLLWVHGICEITEVGDGVTLEQVFADPLKYLDFDPDPFQRAQSTSNILDVERLEEIEAEREGSDLGGYPDSADNPYAGVRL